MTDANLRAEVNRGICFMHRLGVPSRKILGVDIATLTRRQALDLLMERISNRRKTLVAFMNANLMNFCLADRSLGDRLQTMLLLNDGVGLNLASYCFHQKKFPDNLNGTDFLPALLGALPPGTRVFLFGAKPEVVRKAALSLQSRYPIALVGFVDGFNYDAEIVMAKIEAARPDLLLVALGNPSQEQWLAEYAWRMSATLTIGVGAYFDFAAGAVTRAPRLLRGLGLEWAWRLALEPKRLGQRYTVGVSSFLATIFFSLVTGKVVVPGRRARA
ncbi:exopolysaccharide biosynthesis WecB/TagA/CpsF family protein [Rhodoblastus acidophilus]|uniref:WecB/TagA/CpsF family glycosyltransferase n=1 Tax=Rhodoblastus acidophilus TaxID=1074 RepID=UPI0022245CD4|nr:WecB/TagA/CpsF family glycosyltransferase [Rhodoblastus acidophilus]MCW2318373.1 exopolysaccharide biosynthesis WecB/TagA/CpsF family protein [Rhodoblastus acidophilus]